MRVLRKIPIVSRLVCVNQYIAKMSSKSKTNQGTDESDVDPSDYISEYVDGDKKVVKKATNLLDSYQYRFHLLDDRLEVGRLTRRN